MTYKNVADSTPLPFPKCCKLIDGSWFQMGVRWCADK